MPAANSKLSRSKSTRSRLAAVAQRFFAPGIVNQDAAHGFGGGGEEMGAIPPRGLLIAAEPQPGLVNQRGGLQRLAGILTRHL